MGTAAPKAVLPAVEVASVPEIFFTSIEIEVIAGRCARFLLLCEQRPLGCEGIGAENVLRLRATTMIELVPGMIRQTVFALGKHWGKGAAGLLLPS